MKPTLRSLYKFAVFVFAAIGFFVVIGKPLLSFMVAPLFATDVLATKPSPDNAALAELIVRRGGFSTVSTMRVFLRIGEEQSWVIYQNRDSSFKPSLKWLDDKLLQVGLPCGRFDFASNPDDWGRSTSQERGIRVLFTYPEDCSA